MSDSNKKITFITNFVPHYRETFFKKLNSLYDFFLISSIPVSNNGRPALEKKVIGSQKLLKHFETKVFGFDFRYQFGALKTVRKSKPNIVILLGISSYLSNWLILIWAYFKRKKVIIWSSGYEQINPDSISYEVKKFLNKIYYFFSEKVLVYSEKGKENLFPFIRNKDKIVVCYNGIEIDHLLNNKEEILCHASELKNGKPNDKIFLYVGGMIKEKKIDLLIAAFIELNKHYKNIKLWLVGDGPELDNLKNSTNNENIKFCGRQVENVDAFFAACDYFVLPGLGGLALNQAMFWGKPCIVSEADGTEDDLVINDRTGYRFEKNNKQSLVKAMEKMTIISKDIYNDFSKNCTKIIHSRNNVTEMVKVFNNEIMRLN